MIINNWSGSSDNAAFQGLKPGLVYPGASTSTWKTSGQQSSCDEQSDGKTHDPQALAKIAWNSVQEDLRQRRSEALLQQDKVKTAVIAGLGASLGVLVIAIALRVLIGF